MVRFATQVLVGLMLVFGVATLLPKAMLCFKLGQKSRGILYVFLGILSAVFAVLSFGYAYMAVTEGL